MWVIVGWWPWNGFRFRWNRWLGLVIELWRLGIFWMRERLSSVCIECTNFDVFLNCDSCIELFVFMEINWLACLLINERTCDFYKYSLLDYNFLIFLFSYNCSMIIPLYRILFLIQFIYLFTFNKIK